ncbi:MAG TPA: hypothetical protein VGG07_10120 [Solirubrobacteraceae bacterium]|jgi:hypothetical protein
MRRDAMVHLHGDARRHGRTRLRAVLVALTLGLAVALAGCAQSSDTTSSGAGGAAPPTSSTPTSATTTTTSTTPNSGTGSGSLTVSPTTGSPRSVIRFAVTPKYEAGEQGTGDISNALSVMGPQKAGCVGVHAQGLSALPPGQTTTVSLGPAQLGGNWCPGTYTARVEILERPKCGQGMMCPQFIRVLAAIGPVTFKISG